MRRLVVGVVLTSLLAAGVAFAGMGAAPRPAGAKSTPGLTPMQQRLVSGFAERVLESRAGIAPAARARAQGKADEHTGITGCPVDFGPNTQLNQGCLNQADPDLQGRSQSQNETSIAQDPNHPRSLVASSNDYRRGDGNCYAYYSQDRGRTWDDSTVPMSFTRGNAFAGAAYPRQYWQAGGDTSVAWDTKGNAYLSCQVFNRGQPTTNNPDLSSAFYVFRSTGTGGASWNFPGRPVAEFDDTNGQSGALLDKQLMTVDNHVGSPYQDRVYVTWTFFADDGTAYIYEAHSSDHAERFTRPVLVSADSDLCSNDQGIATPQGRCNSNQFSQPFTGPDGALYVVWANFNVTGVHTGGDDGGGKGGGDGSRNAAPNPPAADDNRNQILLAKSTDGGATFSAPVKVSDYYELPDCETYQGQDPFRSCVPEKGETTNSFFRAANYPVGAVNPQRPREVDVTFASYINRHSNEGNGCVPTGYDPETFLPLYDGVKQPGACNNDIVVSRSQDAGRSFTGADQDVRGLPAVRDNDPQADQYWQWADFTPQGRLAVAYHDRGYGSDERTGFSDVTVSGSTNAVDFSHRRVTTSPMPPPTQFAGQFYGDYEGLTAADGRAHPSWSDTREPNVLVCRDSAGVVTQPPSLCTAAAPNAAQANDQNAFTDSVNVPLP